MSGRPGWSARTATGRVGRTRTSRAGACSAWSRPTARRTARATWRRSSEAKLPARGESLELRAAREVVARLNDAETSGRYERWVERARGCTRPVRLRGSSQDADAATGEVVREFTSDA